MKPKYVQLNEARTQGEWCEVNLKEAFQFGTDICIKTADCKDKKGNWIYADRVCEHFATLEDAQYTALAVNNLAVLAEALQNLYDLAYQWANDKEDETLLQAKQALEKIS